MEISFNFIFVFFLFPEIFRFEQENDIKRSEAEVEDSDYEEVIVNNSLNSVQYHPYARSPPRRSHHRHSESSNDYYETMFGMARRFPSIRMEKNKNKVLIIM